MALQLTRSRPGGRRRSRSGNSLDEDQSPLDGWHMRPAAPSARRAQPGVERLAAALGWFSVALGAAQLLAPRALARAAGVRAHPLPMRALGLRELATGTGLLLGPQHTRSGWLWARVAGDAMDLALLAPALRRGHRGRGRVIAAALAVAGVAALDVAAARAARAGRGARDALVMKSITVNRSPQECYAYWRSPRHLARFMRHVESVRERSDGRWHWAARMPLGTRVQWLSELTGDVPGERIGWRAVAGSPLEHAGTVRFEPAPLGHGTVVRVQMHYRPPGGAAGAALAKLTGYAPDRLVQEDLRRFKQLLEAGEIPTTRGQPHGPRSLLARALPLRSLR